MAVHVYISCCSLAKVDVIANAAKQSDEQRARMRFFTKAPSIPVTRHL
jgi:hypothetical protein